MKKFLKTFLMVFLICCIMVGIFLLRNYLILNKIRKLQIDTLSKIEEFNNFVFEENSINEILSDNKKLYCKDGIYKEIDYVEDKITNIKYFNINEPNKQKKEDILSCVKEAFILTDKENFNALLKNSIFQFIKNKDNQYIVTENVKSPMNPYDYHYYYIDKENGMIKKLDTINTIFTYKITENTVTDTDVAKSDINEHKVQENN